MRSDFLYPVPDDRHAWLHLVARLEDVCDVYEQATSNEPIREKLIRVFLLLSD